jgi:hypothetical protein
MQFEAIGLTYSPGYCKQESWYMRHSWNKQQEKGFRDKFIDYLVKHKLATKRSAALEYSYWTLMYGWSST